MARDLDIRLLRAFEAVVRLGGVSSAAISLNRSQPVVSQQIRKLESLVGQSLFLNDRTWKTTDRGEVVLEAAKRIITLNDQLFRHLKDRSSPEHLRIGVLEEFAADHLPMALRDFRSEWPEVTIEVEVDHNRSLISQFYKGQLDLVLAQRVRSPANPRDSVWHQQPVWIADEKFNQERGGGRLPGCPSGWLHLPPSRDRKSDRGQPPLPRCGKLPWLECS